VAAGSRDNLVFATFNPLTPDAPLPFARICPWGEGCYRDLPAAEGAPDLVHFLGLSFQMSLAFHNLSTGMAASRLVVIGEEEVRTFASLTGDEAPVHLDATYARRMGYERPIAHGFLVGSMYSRILGCELPGPNTVIMKLSLDMLKSVYVGDTLLYSVTLSRISEATRTVVLDLAAKNELGEQVSRGTATCVYRI
jgi:3-hydroxybutyryl-CoA dehydratase